MTNQQAPEALAFCWATELAMTQQPVTLSVTEAREVSADMQRLHSENETLQAGYAAARLEIESLKSQIANHADELTVAHLDGRMRAAQSAGVQKPGAHGAIMSAAYDFRDAHLTGSIEQKHRAHTALVSAVYNALRASHGQAPAQAAPQPLPASQVDALDAERLDWLLLHISGAEFRRIGVHYSGNASRADVDAARKQGETNEH